MPVSKKGKFMKAMKDKYETSKGEKAFQASKNSGKIKEVKKKKK